MSLHPYVPSLIRLIGSTAFFLAVSAAQGKLDFEQTVFKETVAPGTEKVSFTFAFVNSGDQPTEITSVKTSCGCTTAKLDQKVYQPGEEGEISGTFNIGSRQGLQKKTVTVYTSDLGQPEIKLGVEVSIPQLLSLKPGLLLWRKGSEPEPKTITVTPNESLGIYISSVESASESFAVQMLTEKKDASGPDKDDVTPTKIFVSPKDTATASRALIKIAATDGNGFERTYFAHALVK